MPLIRTAPLGFFEVAEMAHRNRVVLVLLSMLLMLASSLPLAASSAGLYHDAGDQTASSDSTRFIDTLPTSNPFTKINDSTSIDSTKMSSTAPLFVNNLPALGCPEESDGYCKVADRSEAAVVTVRSVDALPTEESPGWWLSYSPDRDENGMDDRLQRIIAGEYESQSPTNITGPDGRATVAIIIDYGWHPGESDIALLQETLDDYGWTGEAGGAWFDVLETLDSVAIDHVPLSALVPLWRLPGVVVIEQQNVMIPFLDASVAAMKVRGSASYSDTMHQNGYRGDGVVIAVLDTGVDNEHRSLNDFDDVNDDPTDNANEYSDPKFVGGFDATSTVQNPNNDTDPDDGNGHGTHVAGTALGTGDSRRTWMGVAPGAYLVDVKVLTDAGGTNSQNSIAGIQWCTQNANNDWGNNDSSKGIDVMSMSLGSVGNPNGDDPGDNGQSAESRAVNDAVNASIVVVVAMGNDGRRRVPSPASADLAISVAAIDDFNTVDRSDDQHASYSNSGPRESDDDGDDWDELKPDVAAPGSDIYAPEHASSNEIFITKPLADDLYTSKDGTSMATPHVSGLVAVMLQIQPNLDPQEIKDLLRNNSEVRGEPDMTSVSPIWDEEYGFGIVDGAQLMSEIVSLGGGPVDPPPTGSGGDWIIIDWPATNGTMLVEENVERIYGHLAENLAGTIEEVVYKVTYLTDDGNSATAYEKHTLKDWTTASGTDEWSFHIETGSFHEQYHSVISVDLEIRARAFNGTWSNLTTATYELGWVDVTLDEPTGNKALNGTVRIGGDFASVGSGEVQVRVSKGDWFIVREVGLSSSPERQELGEWNYDWDTTSLPEGWTRIATRVVTDDGYRSTELRQSVEIDNIAPAPLFEIESMSVLEYGMPLYKAHVNSYLEVRADLRNIGDATGEDVALTLTENSATRNELTLPRIEPGDTIPITMYWNPLEVGERTLMVKARSTCGDDCPPAYSEVFGMFQIISRPEGVDLTIRPGAIRSEPEIPRPNESTLLTVRIDNLGATEAAGAEVSIERKVEAGWEPIASATAGIISSASFTEVSLSISIENAGMANLRITATPESDLDWSSNTLEFNIITSSSTLGGARSVDLGSGESPVAYSNTGSEAHLLTSKEGSLRLHRLTQRFDLQTCQDVFEESWAGAIATETTGDGQTHIVWSRRVLDDFGFTRQTLSYATIDEYCQSTPPVDLMPELLLSEGSYKGIDLAIYGDTIAVAGYHHDLFTSGTYSDVTSIFTIFSDDPSDSSSWQLTRNVIPDVQIKQAGDEAVVFGLGKVRAHLMYTTVIDAETSIEKTSAWYAHGILGLENWAFKVGLSDNSTAPAMVILAGDENNDIVAAAWRQGSGFEAVLEAVVASDSWLGVNVTKFAAPGLGTIQLHESSGDVQMLADMVGAAGPQIHYGSMSSTGEIALGQRIANGRLILSDRATIGEELPLIHVSSEGIKIRSIIDDPTPVAGQTNWLDSLRIASGLDANTWNLMMYAGGATCLFANLVLLGVFAARRRRSHAGSETKVRAVAAIVPDGEVELLDEEVIATTSKPTLIVPHITESQDESTVSGVGDNLEGADNGDDAEDDRVEAEAAVSSVAAEQRKERRDQRRVQENVRKMMEELTPPPIPGIESSASPGASPSDSPINLGLGVEVAGLPLPLPPTSAGLPPPPSSPSSIATALPLPPPPTAVIVDDSSNAKMGLDSASALPLPPPPSHTTMGSADRQQLCPDCGAKIKIRNIELTKVNCPVCNTTVEL
jgi:subtilisin family serine protease